MFLRKYFSIFLALILIFCGMLCGSEAFASPGAIPLIHGTWNLSGSGYWGSTPVTDSGTVTLVSYINNAGYEVITKFFYEGIIRDGNGNLLLRDSYTLDVELGAGIVVDSMTDIIIGLDSNQYNISLQSGVLASAHRTGVIEGRWVSADYTFTRNSVPAIEPPSSIPSIGGTWNVSGTGMWYETGTSQGMRVTDRGQSTFSTIVDSEGYEVVVGMSYTGEVRDGAGNLLFTDSHTISRDELDGGIRITSKNFPVVFQDNREAFAIDSSTRTTSIRRGKVLGGIVEANYTYTRGGGDSGGGSGGGGCNTVSISPVAALLLFPFLLLLKK